MYQSAATSIGKKDDRNGGLSLNLVESVVNSVPSQPIQDPERTWMADLEPLTVLIHATGRSFIGSLIDRHWRCIVELPVELDLVSAEKAALEYAEQYMHLHLGHDSWVLPQTVQWKEFVAIRSSEDLQRRISSQCRTTSAAQLSGPALRKQSAKEPISAATRPYVLSRPNPSRPTLFLSLSEAARYTGLTEAFLRRKIDCGELPAIKDRGWKLRRADLRRI
jgi:excisionase family DNA binding protein